MLKVMRDSMDFAGAPTIAVQAFSMLHFEAILLQF
jgi:hypothetical protein